MTTKGRIEESFRKLLETNDYDSINVASICRDVGVSRKTFYANYADKEDIVTQIFRRDVIQPLSELNDLLTIGEGTVGLESYLHEHIYRCVLNDRAFYERIIRASHGTGDVFLRVITSTIYGLNEAILKEMGFAEDTWKRDYIAYFFAAGQALYLQQWIADGMTLTVEQMGEFYKRFESPFWQRLQKGFDMGGGGR